MVPPRWLMISRRAGSRVCTTTRPWPSKSTAMASPTGWRNSIGSSSGGGCGWGTCSPGPGGTGARPPSPATGALLADAAAVRHTLHLVADLAPLPGRPRVARRARSPGACRRATRRSRPAGWRTPAARRCWRPPGRRRSGSPPRRWATCRGRRRSRRGCGAELAVGCSPGDMATAALPADAGDAASARPRRAAAAAAPGAIRRS